MVQIYPRHPLNVPPRVLHPTPPVPGHVHPRSKGVIIRISRHGAHLPGPRPWGQEAEHQGRYRRPSPRLGVEEPAAGDARDGFGGGQAEVGLPGQRGGGPEALQELEGAARGLPTPSRAGETYGWEVAERAEGEIARETEHVVL